MHAQTLVKPGLHPGPAILFFRQKKKCKKRLADESPRPSLPLRHRSHRPGLLASAQKASAIGHPPHPVRFSGRQCKRQKNAPGAYIYCRVEQR
jgi:hypothetical protein